MAKKSTSRKGASELWPGHFTVAHAVVALSLMLNVALTVVLIALAQTDIFDRPIAARGAEILCSEKYRASASTADSRALLDFSCATDKAHHYFLNGYNEYRKSVNLVPIKD
jgi:hypothetical protein